jgi:outer membrane protein OmpA-like peptidoglycan-associated protein
MSLSVRVPLIFMVALAAGCQTVRTPPPAGLSPPQVAMLQAQGFRETEQGWMFDMATRLLFPTDTSVLNPDQRIVMARMATALCSVEIRSARVEGHADNVGAAGYNRALSQTRAEAVAGALAEGGMPRGLLRAVGLGETQPIESNATAEGRAENRRVAIIVPADAAGQGPCPAR